MALIERKSIIVLVLCYLLIALTYQNSERNSKICNAVIEPQDCDKEPRLAYIFNIETGTCQQIKHKFCDPEIKSVFKTEIECKSTCFCAGFNSQVCTLPKELGDCPGTYLNYYYEPAYGECASYNYTGCGGNDNHFTSLSLCRKTCDCDVTVSDRCLLNFQSGDCSESIPAYYFDLETRSCKKFIYSGCGGNSNRFHTLSSCMIGCLDYIPEDDLDPNNEVIAFRDNRRTYDLSQVVCLLPKRVGPCRASFKSYFFNPRTARCEIFYYGGCQGNANRFDNKRRCEKKCTENRTPVPVCTLAPEENCNKFKRGWFYIDSERGCEFRSIRSCSENFTGFDSHSRCMKICQ